jgi:orotidine-5'-phosphate decarboxylase
LNSFKERIAASAKEHRSRIVLALDLSGPLDSRIPRAERVLDLTKGAIAAVKMNHHLLLPFGLDGVSGLIRTCRDNRLPLIADLKLNDIESTNMNVVESLLGAGFDAVIANPIVGFREGLSAPIERIHALGGGILLLVYMSHQGADEGYDLRLEGGVPLYRLFAERAKEWGADGVIVSAKSRDRIEETRGIVGKDCLIFSPGLGAQGASLRDVPSIGADFLIVGRTIIDSHEPAATLQDLSLVNP